MPTSEEIRGWARATARVTDDALVGTVASVHRSITDRAFRWVGPVGRPVQRISDAATTAVYDAVRLGAWGAGEVIAGSAGYLGGPVTAPSRAALKASAIANGAIDVRFLVDAPELVIGMSVRRFDGEVVLDRDGLRAAYPAARAHVVVFVHGLVDTEMVWSERTPPGEALPDVAAAGDATPVLVRYATGRAIGHSGADLAHLLDRLVGGWPVPVTRVTLVGHSMGGLVVRSAHAMATRARQAWPVLVGDVVYLGTPHLGSWLEKVANIGTWTLRTTSSSTAPLGDLIDGRSRGIKDLRFGTLDDRAWDPATIDHLLTGRVPDAPWAETIAHHHVVGRLRPRPHHLLNTVFGDALVRAGSAVGAGRYRRVPGAEGCLTITQVPASHTRLVAHPAVASLLRDVLTGAAASARTVQSAGRAEDLEQQERVTHAVG